MTMIMAASIDQAGRKVNLDTADGVSGRDSRRSRLRKPAVANSPRDAAFRRARSPIREARTRRP
jgi:hypothetical protein